MLQQGQEASRKASLTLMKCSPPSSLYSRSRMPDSAPHTGLKHSKLTTGLKRSYSRLCAVNLLCLVSCALMSKTCFRHHCSCTSTRPYSYAVRQQGWSMYRRRRIQNSFTPPLALWQGGAESEQARFWRTQRLQTALRSVLWGKGEGVKVGTETETDRQRDRERETDRPTDRQTERQTDRRTDRQTDRQIGCGMLNHCCPIN